MIEIIKISTIEVDIREVNSEKTTRMSIALLLELVGTTKLERILTDRPIGAKIQITRNNHRRLLIYDTELRYGAVYALDNKLKGICIAITEEGENGAIRIIPRQRHGARIIHITRGMLRELPLEA